MAALGDIFGGFGGGGGIGSFVNMAIWIFFGIAFLGLLGYFWYWILYKKKNWNLKVEIKIPRSDGKLLTAEWGRGEYNTKRGVVFIKRKGKRKTAMEPFDVSKYLQGKDNILTVVQLSPDFYIPVSTQSFLEMEDDETGEVAALMQMAADYTQSKSWKNSFEREAKQAYTIMNLLRDYAPIIGVGIILFMNFAGFAILYTKVT